MREPIAIVHVDRRIPGLWYVVGEPLEMSVAEVSELCRKHGVGFYIEWCEVA